MKKKTTLLILKALISFTLIGVLFSKIDLSELPAIFKNIRISFLFICFILLFINTAISALKWKLLLKADGVDISFFYLLQSYLIGTFFNLFLPTSIGGDVYRIYDIAKKSQDASKSAASVFIDRASGFFALSAIGFLGILTGSHLIKDPALKGLLLFVFSAILLGFITLFLRFFQKCVIAVVSWLPVPKFKKEFFIKLKDRIRRFFEKIFLSFNIYKSKPALLIKITAISLCFQGLLIFIVFLYSHALNYSVSFFYFTIFMPAIVVLESMPTPTLYAVGVRDWGYVLFFSQAGLINAQAAALSILYLSMTVIYSLTGGVVFILKRKK